MGIYRYRDEKKVDSGDSKSEEIGSRVKVENYLLNTMFNIWVMILPETQSSPICNIPIKQTCEYIL